MAFPRLDIVASDLTTVLWSFNDQTGAVNPNSLQTRLNAVRFGHTTQVETWEYQDLPGGAVSRHHDAITDGTVTFYPAASTEDNYAAALGQLNELLGSEGIMVWQPTSGSPLRYIDFLPSPRFAALQGQHLANLKRNDDGLTVGFLMQPWLRGPTVTTASATVNDDPATGTPDNSRIYELTAALSRAVAGDLPTPGKIRVQMDTGATVQRVLIGHRARKSRASTYFSEAISDTYWFNCEATNRNWTITLGTDTTATTDGALASPGSGNVVAQVNGAGSSAGTLTRRVRATRTTAMDSIRGSWVPTVRFKATGVASWEVQVRWGPSTADPVAYAEPIYTHTIEAGTTAFGYVEPQMGRIDIPETVALSGMAVEIWARRVSGTGNLNLDLVDLWPADGLATLLLPSIDTTWLGSALVAPSGITGDPAWSSGAIVGSRTRLNANGEAAGTTPASGFDADDGSHAVTFHTFYNAFDGASFKFRITNETDNTEVAAFSSSGGGQTQAFSRTLAYTAVAGKNYLYAVHITSAGVIGSLDVLDITDHFVPSIGVNESMRTDPARYSVDRLDSSGNLSGYLSVEGAVPALLEPGDNHLKLRADELPLAGYVENENKLDRDLTVTVTYDPRYAL